MAEARSQELLGQIYRAWAQTDRNSEILRGMHISGHAPRARARVARKIEFLNVGSAISAL